MLALEDFLGSHHYNVVGPVSAPCFLWNFDPLALLDPGQRCLGTKDSSLKPRFTYPLTGSLWTALP